MSKVNLKWLVPAALATLLAAGCGGGGGPSDSGGVQQTANPSTSAQGVVDFLLALIGSETSELSEPIATDNITFATEELAESSPI